VRHFFKRILPERHHIQQHRHLKFLGDILHDPEIFHLTRRSTSGGVATGLFFAFLPFPGQMVVAGLTAIVLRVNLPLAVILVWITNPVTIPPLLYLAYKTGAMILNRPFQPITFHLSWEWFSGIFLEIWPSLLTGCLLFSTVAAVAGYITMRLLWRIQIARRWKARRATKLDKAKARAAVDTENSEHE
jgi:uncharacterized protein (DUF2062 family)